MNPDPASTAQLATQIAAAVKPDLWDRLLGPLGALVLAVAILALLWKKFERGETRSNAREDAMAERLRTLEDRQTNVQTQVLQQNAVAYDKMATSNAELKAVIVDLKDTLENLPCKKFPTPAPGAFNRPV